MSADNMALWDAVQKTNPANTKKVNQRGGFTSICAHSQIMEATRQFGPLGKGWGYMASTPIFHDNLLLVQVTLWHGDRSNSFGPVTGGAEWRDKNGRLDSDAAKKATTDALTKLLSQLGFNADVFLGLYDDNKYVAQLEREFAEPSLSADKITEIQMLLKATGIDEITFLRGLKAPDGARICDMPEETANIGIDRLKAKLAQMSQAETNSQAKEAA